MGAKTEALDHIITLLESMNNLLAQLRREGCSNDDD